MFRDKSICFTFRWEKVKEEEREIKGERENEIEWEGKGDIVDR